MAGIGFELRKTLARRTFTAYFKAYMAALSYASGPWICTILSLGGITAFSRCFVADSVVEQFTVTIVYIYASSLLLAGPIGTITTRFVSDRLFEGREDAIAPGVSTALVMTVFLSLAFGTLFSGYSSLPEALEVSAVFLLCIVSCLWIVMSYISCIKNYQLVTIAFALGMSLASGLSLAAARYTPFPLLGLVWGYIVGHLFIFVLLVWISFSELEGSIGPSSEFAAYFLRYPSLPAIGFLTNLIIWMDKFVIWSFHGEAVWGTFYFHSPYDIPAYMAYLTALPSTAFFLIKIETAFAARYDDFIRSLLDAPAVVVSQRKERMINALRDGLVQLSSFQGVITLVFIMVAPAVLKHAGLVYVPTLLFRSLLCAAYFHFTFLHIIIFLMYLDRRKHILGLLVLFVLLSGGFTRIAAASGTLAYFGLGYACAAALSALAALWVLLVKVAQIDADLLFMQPLYDAKGRIIFFRDCSENTYGGRILFERRDFGRRDE